MTKIIKEMLPPDVRVARDTQDLLIECCVGELILICLVLFLIFCLLITISMILVYYCLLMTTTLLLSDFNGNFYQADFFL